MRSMLFAVGMFATSLVVGGALAQTATPEAMPTVTVESSRQVNTTIERGRVPVVRVSLSYTVTAQGVDLTSKAGAQEFEKRVSDAAMAACKELGTKYPGSTPDDAQCAKAATADAMAKVHVLEAAAAMNKGGK